MYDDYQYADPTDEEIAEYYAERWRKMSLLRKARVICYEFVERKCYHWLALEMSRDLRWYERLRFKFWSKIEFRLRSIR